MLRQLGDRPIEGLILWTGRVELFALEQQAKGGRSQRMLVANPSSVGERRLPEEREEEDRLGGRRELNEQR